MKLQFHFADTTVSYVTRYATITLQSLNTNSDSITIEFSETWEESNGKASSSEEPIEDCSFEKFNDFLFGRNAGIDYRLVGANYITKGTVHVPDPDIITLEDL